MEPKVLIFIPSRLSSSRFPGKCLHPIAGFPLICWSYVQARMSGYTCIIVTGDEEIREDMKERNIMSILTSNNPINGTERCGEAINLSIFDFMKDTDVVINVQGDMVLFDPLVLPKMIKLLSNGVDYVSTYIDMPHGYLSNPNRVKCSLMHVEDELYIASSFNRQPVPGVSNYLHIGIYGFTRKSLNQYCSFVPSANEKSMSLEQLRLIDNSCNIGMVKSSILPIVVDCKEDVVFAEAEMRKRGFQGI